MILVGVLINLSLLFILYYKSQKAQGSRNAVGSLFLLVCSSFIGLAVFEHLVLNTNFMVKRYGSLEYVRLNRKILAESREKAAQNPYGFRMNIGKKTKEAGIKRIVVIGDSFVWGDGLSEVRDIWSRKLAGIIKSKGSKTQVIDFGKNGWSTLDEFNFLKKHGIKYAPDLIIWGFVGNDLDFKNYRLLKLTRPISTGLDLTWPVLRLFPRTRVFVLNALRKLLHSKVFKEYGYGTWIKKLYSKKNLSRYSRLISQINRFLKVYKTPFFFVSLPNSPEKSLSKRYKQVKPIMRKNGINFLDLYPKIENKFRKYPSIEWRFKLFANPANNHPGKEVTRIFAQEVYAYLNEHYSQYLFY